jgi:C4-dicarboxylate-specific signal transduction histidine kinase
MQGRNPLSSVSNGRAVFEAALTQFCAAVPAPAAVFDAAGDGLICANSAFRAEFGTLPNSRAQFERDFEPVSGTGADIRASPPADGGEDAPRYEVFCPRSSRWYLFQWSTMRAPDNCELTLLSAQNLTERMDTLRQHRALQEQLLSSSRVMSVGEMTATLAHEINQPLATIVNCLTAARALLAQRGTGGPRLCEALELAFEQAGQVAAVVSRVREFVRTREPRREPLNLRALVDHVVLLQQVDAQKHRVQVTVALGPDLPQVLADRVMVEQVLTNLVRNAIEAMRPTRPAERILTISAGINLEGRVAVRVTDRGPGISAAEEAQLFTPFFTTKRDGMGIGLAICRSIIEFHEGHLYFERNGAGGSAFTFTLPTTNPAP